MEVNARGICLFHPFTFILLCFKKNGQQRKTQIQRKKDDGRQPVADEKKKCKHDWDPKYEGEENKDKLVMIK